MWLFNIFKNKSKVKKIPSRTLDELKNITKILFVDDKAFKVIDNIKEEKCLKDCRRRIIITNGNTRISYHFCRYSRSG